MGRKWKCCCILLLILLLTGCSRRGVEKSRVVTQVDVVCDRGFTVKHCRFTDQAQMACILNYLRLQQTMGPADMDPERVAGDVYRIDIHLSDGTHKIYYQRSDRYYSEERHRWQRVKNRGFTASQAFFQLLEGQ